MSDRRKPTDEVETDVLLKSRRRCALCFGLRHDLAEKRGQLAHVDRDASNSEFENLAYLCLPHHDEYDSRNSQSKMFSPNELARYRDALYAYIESGRPLDTPRAKPLEFAPFLILEGNSVSSSGLELDLRNAGDPVICLDFSSITQGYSVRQWYPPSLGTGDLLRAKVNVPSPNQVACAFQLRFRDRMGAERAVQITVDTRRSPPRFDMEEVQ